MQILFCHRSLHSLFFFVSTFLYYPLFQVEKNKVDVTVPISFVCRTACHFLCSSTLRALKNANFLYVNHFIIIFRAFQRSFFSQRKLLDAKNIIIEMLYPKGRLKMETEFGVMTFVKAGSRRQSRIKTMHQDGLDSIERWHCVGMKLQMVKIRVLCLYLLLGNRDNISLVELNLGMMIDFVTFSL